MIGVAKKTYIPKYASIIAIIPHKVIQMMNKIKKYKKRFIV